MPFRENSIVAGGATRACRQVPGALGGKFAAAPVCPRVCGWLTALSSATVIANEATATGDLDQRHFPQSAAPPTAGPLPRKPAPVPPGQPVIPALGLPLPAGQPRNSDRRIARHFERFRYFPGRPA